MAHSPTFTSILITGASSGIGAALARCYADAGVHLHLTGRNREALADVADDCEASGATCEVCVIDVCDSQGMTNLINRIEAHSPLDLVIANAGISAGTGGKLEPAEQTRAIMTTNVDGVFNTVLPVIPLMQGRGQGQIAIMSSLAGFRGMPGAPAYSASKAAVKSWGEGLRGALKTDGIGVSVICPGFVESGITKTNSFAMPFFMSAEKAAHIIQRGIARNRGRIAFPWPMVFMAWLIDTLPDRIANWITRALPAKNSTDNTC